MNSQDEHRASVSRLFSEGRITCITGFGMQDSHYFPFSLMASKGH
jgi:hypothetical protein